MQTRSIARALPLVLLSALCAAPAAAQSFADTDDEIDSMIEAARRGKANYLDLYYKAQNGSELDYDNAVVIEARTLDLPYGSVTLDGGLLVPVKPKELTEEELQDKKIGERKPIGAVYLGGGSFSWESPHPTEAWSLKKNLEELGVKDASGDKLDVAMSDGTVLFFNGRWRDLLMEGGVKATADKKQKGLAKKMWKARYDLHLSQVARADTMDAARSQERDLLRLEVATKTHKRIPWVTYEHDPELGESTALAVVKRNPLNKESNDGWSLGQWFEPGDAAARTPAENSVLIAQHPLDITNYDMDITMFKDPDYGEWGMKVTGRADFTTREAMRSVTLGLMTNGNGRPVTLKYVRDAEGNNLQFLHRSGDLIIDFGRELPAGETSSFEFSYEGLVISTIRQAPPMSGLDQQDRTYVGIISYVVPDNGAWYPQNSGHSDWFTFDWKLRVPKPMVAASSGTLLALAEEGKFNVHTVKQDTPVTFPAIVFGNFVVRENEPDYAAGEKKIRIYAYPGFEKGAESFIEEIAGIIAYYESILAPYPWPEVDLVQMMVGAGHAQAPAGIVRMTGEVYVSKTDLVNLWGISDPQLRDYFIPHELGHHWWGAIAGFGNYRDQWVSETFAEFCAALYVEFRDAQKAGDPTLTKGYDERAEEWSLRRRGHLATRTAPMWLGYRMSSSKMGGDRWQSTAYARGPLILDMLRRNLGKEAVMKAMFLYLNYTRDVRQGVTLTEDFRTVLEKTVPGMAFEEFMTSYIYGNEVLEGWESKNKKGRKAD